MNWKNTSIGLGIVGAAAATVLLMPADSGTSAEWAIIRNADNVIVWEKWLPPDFDPATAPYGPEAEYRLVPITRDAPVEDSMTVKDDGAVAVVSADGVHYQRKTREPTTEEKARFARRQAMATIRQKLRDGEALTNRERDAALLFLLQNVPR